MAVDNLKDKLARIVSKEPSQWLADAQWRQENKAWLKRSRTIALKVLDALDNQGINQKELAGKMGVSPQQINKIVKGKENLTLETICKLEDALSVELFDIRANIIKYTLPLQKTASMIKSEVTFEVKADVSSRKSIYTEDDNIRYLKIA